MLKKKLLLLNNFPTQQPTYKLSVGRVLLGSTTLNIYNYLKGVSGRIIPGSTVQNIEINTLIDSLAEGVSLGSVTLPINLTLGATASLDLSPSIELTTTVNTDNTGNLTFDVQDSFIINNILSSLGNKIVDGNTSLNNNIFIIADGSRSAFILGNSVLSTNLELGAIPSLVYNISSNMDSSVNVDVYSNIDISAGLNSNISFELDSTSNAIIEGLLNADVKFELQGLSVTLNDFLKIINFSLNISKDQNFTLSIDQAKDFILQIKQYQNQSLEF
jgi:hypothetical protein